MWAFKKLEVSAKFGAISAKKLGPLKIWYGLFTSQLLIEFCAESSLDSVVAMLMIHLVVFKPLPRRKRR